MRKLLLLLFLSLITSTIYSQHESGEIVSYKTFGEGMMVTRAKVVPISGLVSNFFFFNRADEPWNDNVWYEYDWEVRGVEPTTAQAQIRVRTEAGGQLRSGPTSEQATEILGNKLLHYILIRKGNDYVYDIRDEFNAATYDYKIDGAHNGNSKSLIGKGAKVFTTGGNVANIPSSKQLDFSLGLTAFENNWAGFPPEGSYEGDFVVDFSRFYSYSGGQLNSTPEWRDEFNNGFLDYGKWQVATWDFRETQFTPNNIRFSDGFIIFTAERNTSTAGTSRTNLAIDGQASQSTTRYGGAASRAIDGNKNGDYSAGSITHTANERNAWWEVDLRRTSDLDRIVLHNRTNCCLDRLSEFSVSVLDANDNVVWTKFYSNPPSPSLTINLDAVGRKVRVNLDGILSLAEVEVFGTSLEANPSNPSTNLALSGFASQTSTAHGGSASKAVDNNTNGIYSQGSVTHTSDRSNTSWQVELAQNSTIEQIVLFNRTDNCCISRLKNFTVTVLNETGDEVWSKFYSSTPNPSLAIDLATTGRIVKVSLNGTLSLAEVQVFGQPLAGTTNLAPAGIASQSSTINGGGASRAIDRNTSGVWSQGSVTHTANIAGSNWQVRLAQDSDISKIVLFNRTDCCSARLSEFTVSVLDNAGTPVWSQSYTDTPSPSLSINLSARGRTVRVTRNGIISLAEVQVFGSPSDLSKAGGLDESISASDIHIYPNPTFGNLTVDLSKYLDREVSLSLSNLSGHVLRVENIKRNHFGVADLDLSELSDGFYLLLIESENRKTIAKKVIVKKPN